MKKHLRRSCTYFCGTIEIMCAENYSQVTDLFKTGTYAQNTHLNVQKLFSNRKPINFVKRTHQFHSMYNNRIEDSCNNKQITLFVYLRKSIQFRVNYYNKLLLHTRARTQVSVNDLEKTRVHVVS